MTQQLDQERYHTAKLVHWKGMSLRTWDGLVKREKELRDVGNYNIARMRKQLSDDQKALAGLRTETDLLDEEFTMDVREPMAEVDAARRQLTILAAENAANVERLNYQLIIDDSPFLSRLTEENEQLRKKNEEMQMKIEELEQQKSELPLATLASLDRLFDPAPREALFPHRTAGTTVTSSRIVRPAQVRLTTPRARAPPRTART
jgi:hypothetical protein